MGVGTRADARARLVNETISTLLLNYVAPLIVSYFIFGPWRSADSGADPQSPALVAAARLPSTRHARSCRLVLRPGWSVSVQLRDGSNALGPRDARDRGQRGGSLRLGVPVSRTMIIAMALAGGTAGVAGMSEVSAIQGRLVASLSPGYGFIGFLVAWLAGGDAVGIVVMAFLFAVVSSVGDICRSPKRRPTPSLIC